MLAGNNWIYVVHHEMPEVYHLSRLGVKNGEEWYIISNMVASAAERGQVSYQIPGEDLALYHLFTNLNTALEFAEGNR